MLAFDFAFAVSLRLALVLEAFLAIDIESDEISEPTP
jgi:hypothetical protein